MSSLRLRSASSATPLSLTLALSLVTTGLAYAGPTSTWTVDSYKELDEGEAKSALISSVGEVRAGYAAERIDIEYTGSWSMISGPSGELYVGTEDAGAIYRVDGTKATKVASIPDVVAIVSMALGKDGTLYAGTMPGGEVWAVPRGGKAKKLATLEDTETIWSLVLDASGTSLYAGTGPEGKVFGVDPRTGKTREVFATEDKRITAMMAAADGSIWFGTSDKALVFRHDPKTKITRAMADFAGNEISAIAEWNGAAVVAANDLKEPTTSGPKTKSAVDKAKKIKKEGVKLDTPKEGTGPGADSATPTEAEPPRKGARPGKGALFRVRGDGQLHQLHALTSTYFTTIAVDGDGRIYAGAGDKGRIYLIEDDDAVSTVFDVDQRVIAQMTYDDKGGLRFATADSTALYRTAGAAAKAEYLSDTFDAKAPAQFGSVIWRGEGISFETRSGNTAEPGKGWSGWQTPTAVRNAPGGAKRGKVASPPGRYLQYRVKFGDQKASLRQTEVYYLAQNKPTRIEKIELKLPERSSKKLLTVQDKPKPRSPVVEIDWTADNDDGDETVYELQVRREGEVLWRTINTGDEGLTATEFKWNTETYPDGHYRLRVVASDRRSNPAGVLRESSKTTNLFTLDNEKPQIAGLNVRYPAASARAEDSLSAIAEAAFSVDDGPWQVVGSSDGLFDDLAELLQISLPRDLSPGVHTLSLRVADEAGNIAATTTSFRIP